MTYMKICGLLPGDDLAFTNHPSVLHVGFIFVQQSRRYIVPDEARQMIEQLAHHCTPVGVFVNSSISEILDVVHTTGISHVQLHGDETPEDCRDLRKLGIKVWKALRVPNDPNDIALWLKGVHPYDKSVDGFLFDAAPPKGVPEKVTGGHGQTFAWSRLHEALRLEALQSAQWRSSQEVWVAGGIHSGNVLPLLQTLSPFGIDISSGVEERGRKSNQRIQELMKAVDEYDRQIHVS